MHTHEVLALRFIMSVVNSTQWNAAVVMRRHDKCRSVCSEFFSPRSRHFEFVLLMRAHPIFSLWQEKMLRDFEKELLRYGSYSFGFHGNRHQSNIALL